MNITVLICTFNGGHRLESVLAHLVRQTNIAADSWELIIVDNASTDDSSDLLPKLISDFGVRAHLLYEAKPGKPYAIQRGLGLASGRYLAIVDDDNLLDSDYLWQGVKFIESHPNVGAIGGRVVAQLPRDTDPPAGFDEFFAPVLALRDLGDEVTFGVNPVGAGMITRTALLRGLYEQIGTRLAGRVNAGGGDVGEDLEKLWMMRRLGWQTAYVPQLQLEHIIPGHRLTSDYVKNLRIAASEVSPWLQTLAFGRSGSWAARRFALALFCVLRAQWTYFCIGSRSTYGHEAGFDRAYWRAYYLSRARGHFSLYRDRADVRHLVTRLDQVPATLRPPHLHSEPAPANSEPMRR